MENARLLCYRALKRRENTNKHRGKPWGPKLTSLSNFKGPKCNKKSLTIPNSNNVRRQKHFCDLHSYYQVRYNIRGIFFLSETVRFPGNESDTYCPRGDCLFSRINIKIFCCCRSKLLAAQREIHCKISHCHSSVGNENSLGYDAVYIGNTTDVSEEHAATILRRKYKKALHIRGSKLLQIVGNYLPFETESYPIIP